MVLVSKIIKSRALQNAAAKQWKQSVNGFHSGAVLREEEKKEAAVESAAPSPFSDPLIAGPIGLACAIPALQNGFYVLNEESQLACCFLLFCTSVYKFGGSAISNFFDEKAAAILAEHNAIEDANLKLAKETLEAHKNQLSILEDVSSIQEAHQGVLETSRKVAELKLRHEMRDLFVKNLEGISELESLYDSKLQDNMVASAYNNVLADVEKGGKSLKDAAFTNALNALNGQASENDVISDLYKKHIKTFAENVKSFEGKEVELTAEEQAELQSGLDSYMRKYFENAGFKASSKVQL